MDFLSIVRLGCLAVGGRSRQGTKFVGMALNARGYELVGASVVGAGPITDITHVELNDGLTVLYGLNGAGKSYLLRALSDTFAGRGSKKYLDLHVRLREDSNEVGSLVKQIDSALTSAVNKERGEMYSSYSFDEHDILDEEYRESSDDELSIEEKCEKLIELRAAHHSYSNETTAALESIVKYGRYTLNPQKDGTWSLWLSAGISDATPARELLYSAPEALRIFYRELYDRASESAPYQHDLVPLHVAMPYATEFSTKRPGEAIGVSVNWPEWLQIPVFFIANGLTLTPVSAIDVTGEASQLDADTLGALIRPEHTRRKEERIVIGVDDGDGIETSAAVATRLHQLEITCNAHLKKVLIDAPTLRFYLRTPDELLAGLRPQWEFYVRGNDTWVAIGRLSTAQLRWTEFSIELAIAQRSDAPVVFICDEPEQGLHRLAERQVAGGLLELAAHERMSAIVATHSPRVLNSAHVHRVLTFRGRNGQTSIRPLSLSLLDELDRGISSSQLGLEFSDLVQLMNVAVVVEGLHDEVVLKNILRPQLDDAAAQILPMRGAIHAKSLVEARLLFLATEAQILVVLDNISHGELAEPWAALRDAAKVGDLDAARESIGAIAALKVDEAKYLAELASAALETSDISRIHVHGLSQPDIVCYLPESDLLPQPSPTWTELKEDWTTSPRGPKNIKRYLYERKLLPAPKTAELNLLIDEAARAAANTPAVVDPDLIRLGDHIVSLARMGQQLD